MPYIAKPPFCLTLCCDPKDHLTPLSGFGTQQKRCWQTSFASTASVAYQTLKGGLGDPSDHNKVLGANPFYFRVLEVRQCLARDLLSVC